MFVSSSLMLLIESFDHSQIKWTTLSVFLYFTFTQIQKEITRKKKKSVTSHPSVGFTAHLKRDEAVLLSTKSQNRT